MQKRKSAHIVKAQQHAIRNAECFKSYLQKSENYTALISPLYFPENVADPTLLFNPAVVPQVTLTVTPVILPVIFEISATAMLANNLAATRAF